MTVAAGFEIGLGSGLVPGQNLAPAKVSGNTKGAAWTGAVASTNSGTSVADPTSFRSNWQTLLASLGEGVGAAGIQISDVPALTKAAATELPVSSIPSSETAAPIGKGSALQGRPTVGLTGPSLARTEGGIPAIHIVAEKTLQSGGRIEKREPANSRTAELVAVKHASIFPRAVKQEVAGAAAAPVLATATVESAPMAVQMVASGNPEGVSRKVLPQPMLSGSRAETSRGSTSSSLTGESQAWEIPGAASGLTSASEFVALDGFKTPQMRRSNSDVSTVASGETVGFRIGIANTVEPAMLPEKSQQASATAAAAPEFTAAQVGGPKQTNIPVHGETGSWNAAEEVLPSGRNRSLADEPLQSSATPSQVSATIPSTPQAASHQDTSLDRGVTPASGETEPLAANEVALPPGWIQRPADEPLRNSTDAVQTFAEFPEVPAASPMATELIGTRSENADAKDTTARNATQLLAADEPTSSSRRIRPALSGPLQKSAKSSPVSTIAATVPQRGAEQGVVADGGVVATRGSMETATFDEQVAGSSRIPAVAGEPHPASARSKEQVPTRTSISSQEAVTAPTFSQSSDRGPGIDHAFSPEPQAALPIDDKPGLPGSKKISLENSVRSSHSFRSPEAVSLENLHIENLPRVVAADAFSVARDPGDMRGAVNPAAEFSGGLEGSTLKPTPHETFAALDAGSNRAAPTWVHAGAHRAEAGFHDPELGWVGVRADTSGGGVHAALVPGSADAAEAIRGHLAGLSDYLAEHHAPVSSLTMAAPEGKFAGTSGDQGGSAGMQQGAGQNPQQSASSEAEVNTQASNAATSNRALPEAFGQTGNATGFIPADRTGSRHISVMA